MNDKSPAIRAHRQLVADIRRHLVGGNCHVIAGEGAQGAHGVARIQQALLDLLGCGRASAVGLIE